jgi:AcrR family transcriptional regulator
MMTTNDKTPEREEIEMLLPWHAAGTLSRGDAERVEQALSQDPELARHFALAREELGETIHVNETLGAPSARAFERLFTAIEAESPAPRRQMASVAAGWLSSLFGQFSPRTLAWSASAAAVVIMLQGGLITGLLLSERGGDETYETASRGIELPMDQGSFVLVRFNPSASAADITRFLDTNAASIADGPKAGLYRLKVSPTTLPKDELTKIAARLQQDTTVVGFVVPTE